MHVILFGESNRPKLDCSILYSMSDILQGCLEHRIWKWESCPSPRVGKKVCAKILENYLLKTLTLALYMSGISCSVEHGGEKKRGERFEAKNICLRNTVVSNLFRELCCLSPSVASVNPWLNVLLCSS